MGIESIAVANSQLPQDYFLSNTQVMRLIYWMFQGKKDMDYVFLIILLLQIIIYVELNINNGSALDSMPIFPHRVLYTIQTLMSDRNDNHRH